MTCDEKDRIIKALSAFARKAVESEEASRLALTQTGIFTLDGQIRPEYGGPVEQQKED